jgi:hypothetical protein
MEDAGRVKMRGYHKKRADEVRDTSSTLGGGDSKWNIWHSRGGEVIGRGGRRVLLLMGRQSVRLLIDCNRGIVLNRCGNKACGNSRSLRHE